MRYAVENSFMVLKLTKGAPPGPAPKDDELQEPYLILFFCPQAMSKDGVHTQSLAKSVKGGRRCLLTEANTDTFNSAAPNSQQNPPSSSEIAFKYLGVSEN